MQLIPIRTPLIDSLSLSFEIEKFKYLDPRITSQTRTFYNDLEELENDLNPPKPLPIEHNGIKLRFWLTQIPIYNSETQQKVKTTFVNITISAKLLQEHYFQGITKHTIQQLYSNLLMFGIFTMDFDTFINGYAKDVDICINDRMYEKNFDSLISYLKEKTLDQKKHFIKSHQKTDNQGIQYNVRNFAKSLNPHFKIYNKEIELYNRSTEFWNTYLYNNYKNQIKGLIRAEFTIKNYTHKTYLKNKGYFSEIPKTLKEFLEVPTENYYKIISEQGLPNYLKDHNFKSPTDLTPADTIMLSMINALIHKGYGTNEILNFSYDIVREKKTVEEATRSRMKKKLKELIQLQQSNDTVFDSRLQKNDVIHSYLLNGLRYNTHK